MVVAVQQPQPREDPLNAIMKGLSVAESIYGLITNKKKLEQEAEFSKQKAARDDLLTKAQLEETAANTAYKKEATRLMPLEYAQKQKTKEEDRDYKEKLTKDKVDINQRLKDEEKYNAAVLQLQGVGRGAQAQIGTVASRERMARNALAIIDKLEEKDGKVVANPQMARELATAMAALLAQGSPALQSIEEMVPKTLGGTLAEKVQYFTGNPTKYLTPQFIAHFKEQLEREQTYFSNELDKLSGGVASSMKFVLDRNPDIKSEWDKTMEKMKEGRTVGSEINYLSKEKVPNFVPQIMPNGPVGSSSAPSNGMVSDEEVNDYLK